MRVAGLFVVAVLMAACGGDGDDDSSATTTSVARPTTTEPAPDCAAGFEIPLDEPATPDCSELYLMSAAETQGVELTDAAAGQATALCREISISGFLEAFTAATLAWDEGSRPSPADDRSGFIALAIGIYCPEHYDTLRSLND